MQKRLLVCGDHSGVLHHFDDLDREGKLKPKQMQSMSAMLEDKKELHIAQLRGLRNPSEARRNCRQVHNPY